LRIGGWHKSIILLPDGMALTAAAVRDFGTWEAALDSAKVPRQERERRVSFETQAEVPQGSRVRIENDWSLAPIEIYYGARNDATLFKQAFKFWNSWRDAVEAAGGNREHLKQANDTPYSTRAKVVAELKRRARQGILLAKRELTESVTDKQLFVRWRRDFLASGRRRCVRQARSRGNTISGIWNRRASTRRPNKSWPRYVNDIARNCRYTCGG
jgi:hypothetical protein